MQPFFHRSSRHGKFSGKHTQLIAVACVAADIANDCLEVTNVSPGIITNSRKPSGGRKLVKIKEMSGGILLCAQDCARHQEVYIYATNIWAAKLAIARGLRNAGIAISFVNGNGCHKKNRNKKRVLVSV